MKCTILLAIAFAAFASVQSIDRKKPPLINRPNVWESTPYGPSSDNPFDRVRRSPKEPVTGKVIVRGEARKGSSTGGKTEGQIYVGGQVRFRREAGEEKENVNLPDIHGAPEPESQLPLDRVARSPKKGKGRVILRGEAGTGRGGKPDVGAHIMYEYRFRRAADQEEVNKPDVHGVAEPESEMPLDRVARSPKKGKGRVILRGEAGQRRGGKPDVAGHIMYEYRFRRAADQEEEVNKPDVHGAPVPASDLPFEHRSRRSPKEPTTGKIVVQGGARKGSSTGGKTEGQIYVGGQVRFRREAGEEKENVNLPDIHGAPEPASDMPFAYRVARSPKKGKGRVILRGEAGTGRGGKPDVGGHIMYEYRFRRSADQDEDVNRPDIHGAPQLAGDVPFEYSFQGPVDQGDEVNRPDVHGAPEVLKDTLTRTNDAELAANDIVSEEKDNLDLLGHPLFKGYSPADQLEKAEESGQ